MPKRNTQKSKNPKRLRQGQVVVSHQWNDEAWQLGGPMDIKGGLTKAVKVRGLSFIEGAKLIQRQETGSQDVIPELTQIQQDWEAKQGDLKKKDICELQIFLINCLNSKVYSQRPKSFSILLKELCNAENHKNWLKRKMLTTSIEKSDRTVTRLEQPITSFNLSQTQTWLSILHEDKPDWFTQLPSWEQKYLSDKITTWKSLKKPRPNLGDFLGSVPTTIRRYPGTPNAYLSTIQVICGNRTIEVKKIRSGMLAPFDMNKKSQDQKNKITLFNLAQLAGEAIKQIEVGPDGKYTLLLQNLYSTMFEVAGIAPLGKPNTAAVKAMQFAVEKMREQLQTPEERLKFFKDHGIAVEDENNPPEIDLLYSLRPVNSARSGSLYLQDGFLVEENQKTTKAIIDKTKAWLRANPHHTDRHMIESALANYQALAGQMENNLYWYNALKQQVIDGAGFLGLVNSQNPVAEIAAYEQLLMDKIGLRLGSCVSGKDREELVSILLAGLVETFAQHDSFPSPANSGQTLLRNDFYENVAHLYLSGHGMVLAGENAKGCDGIKNPHDIFGAEQCNTIVNVAKNYGIDTKRFHPITMIDKIGGLNKPSPSDPTVYHLPWKRTAVTALFFAGIAAAAGEVLYPIELIGSAVFWNGLFDIARAVKNRLFGESSKLPAAIPVAGVEEAPPTLLVKRKAGTKNPAKRQKLANKSDSTAYDKTVEREPKSQGVSSKRLRKYS